MHLEQQRTPTVAMFAEHQQEQQPKHMEKIPGPELEHEEEKVEQHQEQQQQGQQQLQEQKWPEEVPFRHGGCDQQ